MKQPVVRRSTLSLDCQFLLMVEISSINEYIDITSTKNSGFQQINNELAKDNDFPPY